jgi:hypothetical protein
MISPYFWKMAECGAGGTNLTPSPFSSSYISSPNYPHDFPISYILGSSAVEFAMTKV